MVEPANTPDILTQRIVIAQSLQVEGRWQESVNAYTSIQNELGNDPRIFNGRGVAYRMLKNPAAAISDFTEARSLAQLMGNRKEELTADVGLIDAYRTANRDPNFHPWPEVKSEDLQQRLYQQAKSHMAEAQALIATISQPSLVKVHAYTNFGLLYNDTGNLPEALKAYTLAVANARELVTSNPVDIDSQNRLARALTVQGVTQEGLGDLGGALASQTEALGIYLRLGDLRGIGNSKISMGDVLNKLGKPSDAEALYTQAQTNAKKDDEIIDEDISRIATERLVKLQNPSS